MLFSFSDQSFLNLNRNSLPLCKKTSRHMEHSLKIIILQHIKGKNAQQRQKDMLQLLFRGSAVFYLTICLCDDDDLLLVYIQLDFGISWICHFMCSSQSNIDVLDLISLLNLGKRRHYSIKPKHCSSLLM